MALCQGTSSCAHFLGGEQVLLSTGGYGSEPDEQAEEDAARAATEPRAVKVEVKELPLPDLQVKREVKKEPREAPQELPVQQQREADGTEKDEEVDYEDGTSSESSSD